MKTHRVLNSPTFKSSLPPKQEHELKAPEKYWNIWGKDYWDEFATECEQKGLGKRLTNCMQRIKNNRDKGILVMDRYLSGPGADSYIIGLYDSVEAIEKDRKNGLNNISNTRKGSRHLYYGVNVAEPSFHVTGSQLDKRIKFPKGLSRIEELLTIIERIANPNSKEAKHIGINPASKVLEAVTKMRIKK